MNHIRKFVFLILIVVSGACWWKSLIAASQLALANDAYTYILLVLPLSIALIYHNRKAFRSRGGEGALWGAVLISVGALIGLVMATEVWAVSPDNRLTFSMAGLVIFWIGSTIVCFGWIAFRNNVFPLCFLFLMVPPPERTVALITEFLQRESAWASAVLFRVAGVPVARAGIVLSIPGLDIEVAKECSSIRSSTMLILLTLILAHLFLRTWPRKTLLVLAAIPLSFVKNGIRIFTIAELGTRVDPGFLDGRLHHDGGIIFLALAVMLIVILLLALRKTETRGVPQKEPSAVLS